MTTDRPCVYGTPAQLARLLDSLAHLVESEPDESFVDDAVRKSAWSLTELIGRRLVETD